MCSGATTVTLLKYYLITSKATEKNIILKLNDPVEYPFQTLLSFSNILNVDV